MPFRCNLKTVRRIFLFFFFFLEGIMAANLEIDDWKGIYGIFSWFRIAV